MNRLIFCFWSLFPPISDGTFQCNFHLWIPAGRSIDDGRAAVGCIRPAGSRQRRMEQMQTVITAHIYKNIAFCMHRQTSIDKCIFFCCILLIASTKGPAAASRFEAAKDRQTGQLQHAHHSHSAMSYIVWGINELIHALNLGCSHCRMSGSTPEFEAERQRWLETSSRGE